MFTTLRASNDPNVDRYAELLEHSVVASEPRIVGAVPKATGQQYSAVLASLRELTDSQRRSLFLHPYFTTWWHQVYHAIARPDRSYSLEDLLPHLGRFVVGQVLMRPGASLSRIAIPLVNGCEIRFPGVRTHLKLSTPETCVVSSSAKGDLILECGDQSWNLRDLLRVNYHKSQMPALRVRRPTFNGIEVDTEDPFMEETFAWLRDRAREHGHTDQIFGISMTTYRRRQLAAAAKVARTVSPNLWAEVVSYVQLLGLMKSPNVSSFTTTRMPGALLLSESKHAFSDPLFTAEHFIHEALHQRMLYQLAVDSLYNNREEEEIWSPFRQQSRPIRYVVQGAYVFARLAEFQLKAASIMKEEIAVRRFHEVQAMVAESIDGLHRHASLTEAGSAWFGQLKTLHQRLNNQAAL